MVGTPRLHGSTTTWKHPVSIFCPVNTNAPRNPEVFRRLELTRPHQLDFKISNCLAATRTHFEPVVDFTLQLPKRFVASRGTDLNRADVRTRMFRCPDAIPLRDLADELHMINL